MNKPKTVFQLEIIHQSDALVYFDKKIAEGERPLIKLITQGMRVLEKGEDKRDCLLCGERVRTLGEVAAIAVLYPLKMKAGSEAIVCFLCRKCSRKKNLLLQCGDFMRENLFNGEQTDITIPHDIGGHA